HRQHPRAKRLTGSKQKLTELGLIAYTTISKAFPLLSVDSIIKYGSTNGYYALKPTILSGGDTAKRVE
ncbi:MAG: hypothetical protein EWV50_13150, partial [Microcystis aeruginosa Ma_MB_F_20061100_S20]